MTRLDLKGPPSRERRLALAAILGLFLLLGGLYSVVDPIFEASDELVHYPYVKYLADNRGLPVPSADPAANPAQQEATQPPLYYAIGALATFWIDTGDLGRLYLANPHSQIGRPESLDNKNMVVHSPAEAFPYRGVALAVHLVRLLSVAMGSLTVLLTYLIAREVAPGRPALALGASLVNALVPQFLFIAGSVNNDNMVTLLSSLTLLLLLRTVRRELAGAGPSPWLLALLGASLGLAALAKLSGLMLLPLAGLVVAWLALRRRSPARFLFWSAVTFGVAFLVAGWWYVRNWLLYGDPTLLTQHVAIVHGRPHPVTLLDVLLAESQGLRWSFWGVFGGFNVVASPLIYRLYDLLTLLAVAGLGLAVVRWARGRVGLILRTPFPPGKGERSRLHPARPRSGTASGSNGPDGPGVNVGNVTLVPAAILALWCVLLFASLLRWTLTTMASQGRLLFPAISAICLGLFFGWQSLVPKLSPRLLLAGVGATLLLLALLMPFRYIAPAYAAPPKLAPGSIKALFGSQTIDVSFDDKLTLVAVRLSESRIVPGRTVAVDLYWRVAAPMDRNYSIYVHLYDGAGRVVAQQDTYPGGGAYATSQLLPGDELHDRYLLRVAPDARAGAGHLDVGLYEYPQTMARLPAYDGAHRLLPSPNVASFQVFAPDPASAPAQSSTAYAFGDTIELTGYRLDVADARPGGAVAGGLYWRARGQPDRDYTVFVHLAHPGVPPVAQFDAPPQGGAYPTSLWRPGDAVYHPFRMALANDVPPGEYALLAGLYDPTTGRRLEMAPGPLGRVVETLRRLAGRAVAPETAAQVASVVVRSGEPAH